jgi:hypothetical protein
MQENESEKKGRLNLYIRKPLLGKDRNGYITQDISGHVFVGLKKSEDDHEIKMHFSPKSDIKALISPFVENHIQLNKIEDPMNSDYYDHKIEYAIDDKQYNDVFEQFNRNQEKKYSLLTFNCYHFSKSLVQAAGLPFPKTNYAPSPLASHKRFKKMIKVYNKFGSDLEKVSEKLAKSFSKKNKAPVSKDDLRPILALTSFYANEK